MFYDLLDGGHDPRKIDYKDLAINWIKQNILKKCDLDCNEINWIKNTVSFFCKNAKNIWKKHKGRVTGLNVQNQHSKFLDKFINATNVDACKCIKCYVLETRTVETSSASQGPESNDDTNITTNEMIPVFDDPYPIFCGKKLQNQNGYICYLNSIINGLLALKTFRESIQFMELHIKDIMTRVLDEDLKNLEELRHKLHEKNSDFSFGSHCDPCEALTTMLHVINLDYLYQKSLVKIKRHQSCSICGNASTFDVEDPYGNPNILKLMTSNESTVQDEVNVYLQNFGSNEPEVTFCSNCQQPQPMILKDSLETSEILIIRIHRFKKNGAIIHKIVLPNNTIKIGSLTYELKCFISHHGNSAQYGHYTSTIPFAKNSFYKYDDTVRILQSTVSNEPYILFYERVEEGQEIEALLEDAPTFFDEQIIHRDAIEKEFIYPTSICYEFTRRAIMHKNDDEKQIPLLAYIAGYIDGNKLIGTEIIFPQQSVNGPNLNDLGKV